MSSIKKKAITGTIWTIAGHGGGQILRLGSNLILTRLLVPELFGLMALINTFIAGLNLFSDIGIRPSIIRSPRGDDPVFLNTAWTVQVIRGLALWLACCVIAWPVAQFYAEPQFVWLLPLVGLTTILAGFTSVSLATLNRKMEMGKLTLFTLFVQIVSLSVMIVLAYFYRNILPLVVGTLISNFVRMVLSYKLDKTKSQFAWDKESLTEIFSFGRWTFISTAMMFLASQSDKLIFGRLLPLEVLGVYTIALNFAMLPRTLVSQVSNRVIFPIISSLTHLPRQDFKNKVLLKRKTILIPAAVMLAIVFNISDGLVLTLYDENYSQAAWMLPILLLGIWPNILYYTSHTILLSMGKPIYSAIGDSGKLIYMLILLPLAIQHYGILGGVVVVSLNDLPLYGVIVYGMWRESMSALIFPESSIPSWGKIFMIFSRSTLPCNEASQV